MRDQSRMLPSVEVEEEPSSSKSGRVDAPLTGVRVLDLSRNIAGPFASMILADLGAEVIKLEHPASGDELRSLFVYSGRSEDDQDYFEMFNRNKKSLAVDLKHHLGQKILRDLIRVSDVFVENLSPGAVDRLGFGQAAVRKLNPSLIYCSLSGFGKDGFAPALPAYDGVVQAASGLMALTGQADGAPSRTGAPLGDIAAALFATISICSSLVARFSDRSGEYVDISMFDSLISIQGAAAAEYFATGTLRSRMGNEVLHRVPQNVYQTSDGNGIFITTNNESWGRLCRALGLERLGSDARFDTNQKRLEHRDEINLAIQARLTDMRNEEAYRLLRAADVPCSPVATLDEAVESDVAKQRGMVLDIYRPNRNPIRAINTPFKFSVRKHSDLTSAPMLGEHTASILKELLGYEASAIDALCGEGVVGCTTPLQQASSTQCKEHRPPDKRK